MSQQVRVDEQELISAGKEIAAQINQYEQVLQKVQQIVQSVVVHWEGDSKEKFLRDMELAKVPLNLFINKMSAYAEYLGIVAQTFSTVDADLAKK